MSQIDFEHFLFIGARNGHHCSHHQYRCQNHYYYYYYYYYYYNYISLDCINSTLACNGQFDCSFGASDEEGCGMFPIHIDDCTINMYLQH